MNKFSATILKKTKFVGFIEKFFPKPKPSMYLYGTPSESGNIGLRVGDTVTYYDGAVLPKLPESDLSYTVVCHDSPYTYGRVIYSAEPLLYDARAFVGLGLAKIGHVLIYGIVRNADWWEVLYPDIDPSSPVDTWVFEKETVYDETSYGPKNVKWANYDVNKEAGGVYLAKGADPIPINRRVGDSYNGIILPKATIIGGAFTTMFETKHEGYSEFTLISSGKRFEWSTDHYAVTGTAADKAVYNTNSGEWTDYPYEQGVSVDVYGTPVWADYDLTLADGSVLAKSETIPIYE